MGTANTLSKAELEQMAQKIGRLLGLSPDAQNIVGVPPRLADELNLCLDILVSNSGLDWDFFDAKRGEIVPMPTDRMRHSLEATIRESRCSQHKLTWPEMWGGGQPPRTPETQLARHKRGVELEAEARAGIDLLLGDLKTLFVSERAEKQAALEARLRADLAARAVAAEVRAQAHLNRVAPAPGAQPYGVSHRGAEHLVADWMRHLGVLDAAVTRQASDGGIDVDSATHVAQVKNYVGSVGVDAVRELFGVATAMRKAAIFFTSGTFTTEARAFADVLQIPLIQYNAEAGTVHGVNSFAEAAVTDGLVHPQTT